jgi:hypothetical protein
MILSRNAVMASWEIHKAHNKGEIMPIETVDIFGDDAVTFKKNETAYVQTVKVGTSLRVEARIYYVNETTGAQGYSKTSISFDDPLEAMKFAAQFSVAADEFADAIANAPVAAPVAAAAAARPVATKKVTLNAGAVKNRPPRKAAAPAKKAAPEAKE